MLKSLNQGEIKNVVEQAIADQGRGLGEKPLKLDGDALDLLTAAADGDARRALNLLEIASDLAAESDGGAIDKSVLEQVLVGDTRRFDKGGEYFYDRSPHCISPFAAPPRTLLFIGSVGCWMVAATPSTLPGGWCAWPVKILAMRIPGRWILR